MVSAVVVGGGAYLSAVNDEVARSERREARTDFSQLKAQRSGDLPLTYHPNREYEKHFGLDPVGEALVKSQERVDVLTDRVRVLERQVDQLQRAVFGHRIGEQASGEKRETSGENESGSSLSPLGAQRSSDSQLDNNSATEEGPQR